MPHPRDEPATVDLRSAAEPPSSVPDEAPVLDVSPVEDSHPRTVTPQQRLRSRRRIVVGALIALVGVFVLQLVLVQVMYDQRQTHLAGVFQEADARVTVGEPLMIMQIPAIDVNDVVIEGASASELRSGPGHVEGSAEPGEPGNIIVVGRRSRYGGPFGELGTLPKGAEIVVKTRSGLLRTYKVEKVSKIRNGDALPIEETEGERLTLVTSGGGWHPSGRVVVTATSTDATPAAVTRATPAPSGPALATRDLDRRTTSGLGVGFAIVVLLAGLLALAAGLRELSTRYGTTALLATAIPAVALLVLVLVFTLDGVFPATL